MSGPVSRVQKKKNAMFGVNNSNQIESSLLAEDTPSRDPYYVSCVRRASHSTSSQPKVPH